MTVFYHAERSAWCANEGTFWCEPGARDARTGEFEYWLQIQCKLPSFITLPWPFEVDSDRSHRTHAVDAAKVEAFYHMTNFESWPGEWWNLCSHMITATRSPRASPHASVPYYFWWGLYRTPIRQVVPFIPENELPRSLIDALTRPREASR